MDSALQSLRIPYKSGDAHPATNKRNPPKHTTITSPVIDAKETSRVTYKVFMDVVFSGLVRSSRNFCHLNLHSPHPVPFKGKTFIIFAA